MPNVEAVGDSQNAPQSLHGEFIMEGFAFNRPDTRSAATEYGIQQQGPFHVIQRGNGNGTSLTV
jgi:hypothetical protein